MKVKVQGTLGSKETQEFDFDPQQTVREAREEVAAIKGIDVGTFSLANGGKALPDDRTFASLGIRDGEILSTLPRDARGGYDLARVRRLRIRDELERITSTGADIRRVSESEWVGTFQGRGLWSHQQFHAQYVLPDDYPGRPPLVRILTRPKPRHPNISPEGFVCLNYLKDAWRPSLNLVALQEALALITATPNYENPLPGQPRSSWLTRLFG